MRNIIRIISFAFLFFFTKNLGASQVDSLKIGENYAFILASGLKFEGVLTKINLESYSIETQNRQYQIQKKIVKRIEYFGVVVSPKKINYSTEKEKNLYFMPGVGITVGAFYLTGKFVSGFKIIPSLAAEIDILAGVGLGTLSTIGVNGVIRGRIVIGIGHIRTVSVSNDNDILPFPFSLITAFETENKPYMKLGFRLPKSNGRISNNVELLLHNIPSQSANYPFLGWQMVYKL
jgi:hypothetical protein